MKVVIVSGFFNPLHGGHLDMIEAAREMGDKLIVIVNNDAQQVLKKGKVILKEENRVRLLKALRDVDEVILSIDQDPPVLETLREVAKNYEGNELIFANGGDRDSNQSLPEKEDAACTELGIKTVFGVGSHEVVKRDSSSRINQETGHEIA